MADSADIPPVRVQVNLRMRCSFRTRYWTFCRYAPVEHQLDSALLLFKEDEWDAAFEDAVGILVNGTVYVDDEPYWKNLLTPDATYEIVYVRRPIWHYGICMSMWIWLCDVWHNTPNIERSHIPRRSPDFCTRKAYSRLIEQHPEVASERKPCTHNEHLYWYWNGRSEGEMVEVKKQGRWVVYERMRLFNPSKARVE